jgi:hypothetical protein
VNGCIAEGARVESGWHEGMRWGAWLRVQAVVHCWDLLCWCCNPSQAWGYSFLWCFRINEDRDGDSMRGCMRRDQ